MAFKHAPFSSYPKLVRQHAIKFLEEKNMTYFYQGWRFTNKQVCVFFLSLSNSLNCKTFDISLKLYPYDYKKTNSLAIVE